ncbi:C-C motif chemokine 7-like [Psammomys obesus]|uniref:C-C motif chemokine 7-like n=1 Tax=Psammomys obesus TaxID=48139 RepID=UPI002452B791|nr:C-C motif chemokine 7-like [Psammomys obesus]
MQVSAILLCLLLTAATFSIHIWAQPDGIVPPTCCYVAKKQKLPMKNLKSYIKITSSRCPWEAVIFRTKKGMEVCTEAQQDWVQEAMKYLDKKSQTPNP